MMTKVHDADIPQMQAVWDVESEDSVLSLMLELNQFN